MFEISSKEGGRLLTNLIGRFFDHTSCLDESPRALVKARWSTTALSTHMAPLSPGSLELPGFGKLEPMRLQLEDATH